MDSFSKIIWSNLSVFTKAVDKEEEKKLLDNISFCIQSGEWVQLYGRNGSGKSTLLKLLAGFERYRVEGTQRVNRPEQLTQAHLIPIVLQQPSSGLIGSTCWEDVVLMMEQHQVGQPHMLDRAEQVFKQLGLEPILHQPLEALSGGQQQLAAIAGAAAVSSDLLLMDEVTSMLDKQAAQLVLTRMRELNKQGVTVIWATQQMEEAVRGDHVIALDQGRIVFNGPASQWFARDAHNRQGSSPCEEYGFEAPYAVQIAWQLADKGIELHQLPLNMDELKAEVYSYEY